MVTTSSGQHSGNILACYPSRESTRLWHIDKGKGHMLTHFLHKIPQRKEGAKRKESAYMRKHMLHQLNLRRFIRTRWICRHEPILVLNCHVPRDNNTVFTAFLISEACNTLLKMRSRSVFGWPCVSVCCVSSCV